MLDSKFCEWLLLNRKITAGDFSRLSELAKSALITEYRNQQKQ